jgi:hypothetical protein
MPDDSATPPVLAAPRPHWGFTRHHGFAVHARTADHLQPAQGDSAYQRFNKRFALILVRNVGTMTCFWVFCLLSLTVLPSVLYAMGLVSLKHALPAFVLGFGFELLTTWLFSTGLQLVLLPGLMVGQNVQNQAADARAAKQFEDTEIIADRLDTHTAGGLAEVLTAVRDVRALLTMRPEGGTPGDVH